MIHPEEQRIMKMMEVLERSSLFAKDELALAEDYLLGNAGQQELETLAFRDMSGASDHTVAGFATIFEELMNKGRMEEGRRLVQILFAAGQTTCMKLLPSSSLFYNRIREFFPEDPVKRVLVCARKPKEWHYISVDRAAISYLIKLADNAPENIKKALECQKNATMRSRLLLLAAYFAAKYPNVEPAGISAAGSEAGDRPGKKEGLLAGVGRFLGKKPADTDSGIALEEQDALMLKEYEDIIVDNLHLIYYNDQSVPAAWKEIRDAVNSDRVDSRIMKLAEAKSTHSYMLHLLGGMSYMNFSLSTRLRNAVKVCLGAAPKEMLAVMLREDLRDDMAERGGSYDLIFGMDPAVYIEWIAGHEWTTGGYAAIKGEANILKEQYRRNRECFLEYMAKADFEVYNRLASILREEDPEQYRISTRAGIAGQQARLTNTFVGAVDRKACSDVRAYLEEGTAIEALYPYGDKLIPPSGWQEIRTFSNLLKSYQRGHGYDAFGSRCEALMMLCGGFKQYLHFDRYNNVQAENVKRLFSSVDLAKLPLRYQLNGYSDIASSYNLGPNGKKVYAEASREIFRKYLAERREEILAAVQDTDSDARSLVLELLAEQADENKAEILRFAQDTAKGVKEELLDILYRQKGWEEDIVALLSSKKATDRDVAVRVLSKWDGEKYAPLFAQALEKEKNGKVRALLDTALNGEGGSSGESSISLEELVKELHKGNKKRSLAWAYEKPFSKVHKKNGQEAEEEYLQAILLCYSSMSPCGISRNAAALAEELDENELAVYVNELFDKWMEAGAESKKRWALYAAAIHGGSEIVGRLHHQIQEWPQAARGAIASEAVQALALNPTPQALLIVDGISRKFKFKQVKAAAGKALEFAASQLGITREELADRIVPDLGFDENMERRFDYGERQFTVTITPALEVEVFDESGKKLKNLPAPGKRDDEAKAAAAYGEFKQMKKQLKTTVSSQKMRLDMALSTERRWSVGAWKDLFVRNPIMHQFAIGLIWGVYEDKKLVSCFRYMEDGSFNTEDEEEFELPESNGTDRPEGSGADCSEGSSADRLEGSSTDRPKGSGAGQADRESGAIGLVHPIELSKESLEAWKQQLEDYEIEQPIEQLGRPVYRRTEEEEEQRSLERFGGCIVNDLSLGGKLMGEGWYRGSVQDAGGFYTYYREDPELSLGVELHFSGSYVGGGNDDVTVYEARFYRAGTIKRGSYEYDQADDKNSYLLKEVPERYFSEVVRQIAKAVASGKDRNENWKQERR